MTWSLTIAAILTFGSFALTIGTGAQAWADLAKSRTLLTRLFGRNADGSGMTTVRSGLRTLLTPFNSAGGPLWKLLIWVPGHEPEIHQKGGRDAVAKYSQAEGYAAETDKIRAAEGEDAVAAEAEKVRKRGGDNTLQFVQLVRAAVAWDLLFVGSLAVLVAAGIQLWLTIQRAGILP
jgi:hypothetical protein